CSCDSATCEIYTLSLHDALPISALAPCSESWRKRLHISTASRVVPSLEDGHEHRPRREAHPTVEAPEPPYCSRFTSAGSCQSVRDRKSTRLNSSHVKISYAVFCL